MVLSGEIIIVTCCWEYLNRYEPRELNGPQTLPCLFFSGESSVNVGKSNQEMKKEGWLEVTPRVSFQQISNKDKMPITYCELCQELRTPR